MAMPTPVEDEILGRKLFGDRFSSDEIRQWYEVEVGGFFDLLTNHYKITDEENQYEYEYVALNHFHALDTLLKRQFDTCVALGCAAGDDIAPLAPVIKKFFAIEPAEKWWRSEIGGKPAVYLKPSPLGDVALDTGSVDLVTSFGVLHHIPNVSHVVSEIARVLAPGGIFVVREPITSMGDWTKPRQGLTANERGLPLAWFEQLVTTTGFKIVRRHTCMFNPLLSVCKRGGISTPLSRKSIVVLDWLFSMALQWNMHYWRNSFLKKLAPSSAFWILQRTGEIPSVV